MTGRIRMVADQIRLSTAEGNAGDLVFEPGLVGGVSGTVLRSALIGDLTVDTLQLQNESVTMPNITTYAGPTGIVAIPSYTWTTKMEDTFLVTSPAGSTIYLQIQADIYAGGQGNTDPVILLYQRLTVNGSEIRSWAEQYYTRRVEFFITALAATGSPQAVSLKWEVYGDWPAGGYTNVNIGGAQMLRVAMKR
ncbi:hypothetical protein RA307_23120 [Xanthobacteraceae bacterium Astr-EGSB]|uniref:hypothetical protein n=1 Tax=Astrobacterium formosum TaxID=3069710 RepID=UPI0027B63A50|nr:hypothetical protein [Xanthobacteraceae bacterium Astr-EGSB]